MQTEIEKLASEHYPEYYSIGLGNDKIGFERGYNLGISSQTENKGLDWLVSHWKKLQSEGEKMNWEQIIQITELAKEAASSQTEISDEEIAKESEKYQGQMNGNYAFTMGAKWYREQLKKK